MGFAAHAFTAPGAKRFECAYDTTVLISCGGNSRTQATSGLGDGQHTFTVQAFDAYGNHGAKITDSFTVDSGPGLDVFARPTATLPVDVVAFAYDAPGATRFECAVDSAAWSNCPGWYTAAGSGDGSHVFHVRAFDTGGNSGAQVDVPFTVEASTPETTITNGPANSTQSRIADFTFVASETATFACTLDGTSLGACVSPVHLTGMADGPHDFSVAATDTAGHTDLSPAHWTWTVDVTKPVITITSAPSGTVFSDTASVSWSVNESVTSVECALDGAAFLACANPKVMTALADGPHSLVLRATDVAGNVSNNVTVSWTVSHAAPDTTITSGPAANGNNNSPTFTFTSGAGATFECRIDGAAFTACTSPKNYPAISDGSHTFDVRATVSGVTDPTPASASFIVDTVSPDTTITAKPAAATNATTASFSFTSTKAGSTFQCSRDGAAFAACVIRHVLHGRGGCAHLRRTRHRLGRQH